MKKNDWILIISVILYSWMFYQQSAGLNFLIFSVGLIILLLWRNPSIVKDKNWYVAASGTLITGISVALFGTLNSVIANIISISLMSALSISKNSSILLGGIYSLYSYASAIGFMIADLIKRRSSPEKTTGNKFWIRLAIAAGIIIIFIVFFVLYQRANPLFLDLTRKINFDFISWEWVRFTFFGFVLLYGFFYHRNFPRWLNWDSGRPKFLDREKVISKGNNLFGKSLSINWEINSGVVLFVLLNMLLLIVNILDLYYMWITKSLPIGMTYADYVHQGTTNLIISIIFAILITLFFFRGQINFSEQSRLIKILAFIWIIQNILVIISTAYRNYLYIDMYSLTYKRIGIYLWLILTTGGLITTYLKISAKKTTWYLFRANGWVAFIVLVLFACQNWDSVIAKFNLSKSTTPDKYYVLDLQSPAILPELLKLRNTNIPIVDESSGELYSMNSSWVEVTDYYRPPYYREDYLQELHKRVYQFLIDWENSDWQSWNLGASKTANELYKLSEEGKFEKLQLNNMNIDSLGYSKIFVYVKDLNLDHNQIKNLKSLSGFTNLNSLSLGYNYIYDISSLPVIPGLTEISLNGNYLQNTGNLNEFSKLEVINLSNNSNNINIDNLADLKNLRELNLNGTPVENYTILKKMTSLRSLSIASHGLKKIEELPILPQLEEIDLSNNALGTSKFKTLSKFRYFSGLKTLILSGNQITNLYILTSYDKNNENDTVVPVNKDNLISIFSSLENLNVSSNNITDIRPLIYYNNLKSLDLSNNTVYELSTLEYLTKLEHLNIYNTGTQSFDNLSMLTRLKELNISSNYIVDISKISNLKQLEVLKAGYCGIGNPAPLSELSLLKELYLNNNEIHDLSFIVNMKSLRILNLANNSITDFSPLYQLKGLEYLYLDYSVSSENRLKLKENLPGTKIHYEYMDYSSF